MPVFVYKARRQDGSAVTGTLPADNERAALLTLDRQGLLPSELVQQTDDARAPGSGTTRDGTSVGETVRRLLGRRIGAETVARFSRELADLVKAGVPILRALDAVSQARDEGERALWGAADKPDDRRARAVLREVRRDVAQGAPLHQALGQRPELFGGTSVSLIRAGEAGGFLDQSLQRVAVFAERDVALQRRVKGALTYPFLLMLLSAAAVVFLLAWVVPRFAVIYDDLGGALPAPTRLLMAAGDLVRARWYVGVGLLVAAGVGAGRAMSTERGRRAFDAAQLRIWGLRGVIGQACVARFCRTLGTLLGSGVPILQALEIAKGAAGNLDFTARLGDTLASLREGAGLAQPLRETRLFPPQVLEMIEVGQESGSLVEVLERAGDRADEEVDHSLRTFVAVLEPALIVAVASVVFFVIVAALLPVFTLNTLVH